jgi:hypothetical protein
MTVSSDIVPAGMSQSLKSFWSRPEGKVGAVVLAAGAAGSAFALWRWALPFLVSMVEDTLHLALLCLGLGALGYVVVKFGPLANLVFRLVMRKITGLVIEIDPIGILKDRVTEMKKRRDAMNEQIAAVRGSIQTLTDITDKNTHEAESNLQLAEQARRRAAVAPDGDERQRMEMQMRLLSNKAERLKAANASYDKLLARIKGLYTLLTKWATNVDYFIDDTEDQVRNAEVQSRTINKAYGAFRSALNVFHGNAREEEMYDSAMEYLADQASEKLGAIEDFQRVATNFMDTMDLKNGVVQEQALHALDAYEQKVLTQGKPETAFLLPGAPVKTTVNVEAGKSGGYFK